MNRVLTAAALAALLTVPALAQTTQPVTPAKPVAPATTAAPAAATPAAATPAAKPVPAATQAQSQKLNLNSATAKELDALPQIGEARAKAIVEARAKSKFKDWNDFVARKVVPSNAEDAIKDKVTF